MFKPGVEYTIATGRLFCKIEDLQGAAELLMGRNVYTHEFADEETWENLRNALQSSLTAKGES